MSWFSQVVKHVAKPSTFAGFIPAIAGGALSFLGAERRNRAEAASARSQMEFQRQMSNTATQRQMADLQRAGLNPILSGKLGGATTPTGAMHKPTNSFEKAITSAYQVAQLQNLHSQTELTNAKTQIENQKVSGDFGTHQANKLQKEIRNLQQSWNMIRANVQGKKLDNTIKHWENKWYMNIYKSPKATLQARWENFLISTGFAGMPKSEIGKYQANFNRAFAYVNNNFKKVLDNPDILKTMVGTTVASYVLKTMTNALPFRNKTKGKSRGFKR